jgi:radical SAM superfamily enzyme YgiQ (UPF0313 family)
LKDFESGKLQKWYQQTSPVDFSGWPAAMRECYSNKRLRFITVNSVQATYGCPNRCDFCVTPYSVRGYYHRPVEDVINEIRNIKAKHILFVDPSPIEDVGYAKQLYKAMVPLGKKWVSPSTISMAFDEELLDIAAESGCKGLLIGFESVSAGALLSIHKGFNQAEKYHEAVENFHKKGIAIMGCFVFGLDTDDAGVFKRTVDFINESNIDLPRFTVCTAYPGTPLYKRFEAENRIIERNWLMYDCQHVMFRPKSMSPEELQSGLHWAWREAYKLTSIIKRLACSRTFLEVALLSSLTYRMYGRRLPLFTRQVMTDLSDINDYLMAG